MKRRSGEEGSGAGGERKVRRVGGQEEAVDDEGGNGGGGGEEMGEDLLFEVLRHADAGTLATAACVSRLWRRTAEDERLWEGVCTRHWANFGCAPHQLRSVVLALGGFRRLHALYLRPLLRQPSSSAPSSSSFPPLPLPAIASSCSPASSSSSTRRAPATARWGKDEMHLSLCLYSIRYFNDKINVSKR